ncbi:MAG: phosphotransferase, partial [Paracoccaceae bacterium]
QARIAAFHKAVPVLPQRPGSTSLPELAAAPLPQLPPEIAALCRAALASFAHGRVQAIHGDVTAANLIHTADGPALIDWDEARCDLPFLDLVHVTALPRHEARAHLAWEVITGWAREPAYAKACADRIAQA